MPTLEEAALVAEDAAGGTAVLCPLTGVLLRLPTLEDTGAALEEDALEEDTPTWVWHEQVRHLPHGRFRAGAAAATADVFRCTEA